MALGFVIALHLVACEDDRLSGVTDPDAGVTMTVAPDAEISEGPVTVRFVRVPSTGSVTKNADGRTVRVRLPTPPNGVVSSSPEHEVRSALGGARPGGSR